MPPAAVAPRAQRSPLAATPARPARWAPGWILFVLAGQAAVALPLPVPALQTTLAALLLLGVPLFAVGRRVQDRVEDALRSALYAAGAVVLGIIAVALLLNTVLPWVGDDRPLARPVLLVASTLIDVALVARRPASGPLLAGARLRDLARAGAAARFEPAVGLGVLALVLSVAGAVRLNNGLDGTVAVLAHVAVVAAFGAALARRGSPARNVAVVYLSALSLLLGTSLRGWYITGHDIQNEYLAFLYTHRADHWVMSAYPQPYNACLSVNILPSVLVGYLGVGGVVVFKVVLQAVFALVPVAVYAAARKWLPPRVAVMSTALFVFFPTFFTDMPFLVRQEIAYLFLALALLTATEQRLGLRARRAATVAFGLGVVLSHYSTTYVLVMTLLIGTTGVAAGNLWRRYAADRVRVPRPVATGARRVVRLVSRRGPAPAPAPSRTGRRWRGPLVLLGPVVVLVLTLGAWAWSSPATHSGGHLADTVGQLTESIINGNAKAGSSDANYSIFGGGGGPTDAQRFHDFVRDAATARAKDDPAAYVFPQPTGDVAQPQLVERTYLPLTVLGDGLRAAGADPRVINTLLRTAGGALFQVFLLVGLLGLVGYGRYTRRLGREQFWLTLASVAALSSVVVVPGLSADYGVLRAFQQTLLFAAPLLAVGLLVLVARLGRWAWPAAVTVVLGMGLVLTGAQPAALGGYYAVLSQSNSGQYYDLLYADDPELSAAQWMARTTDGTTPATITAADIVSVTRLQQFVGRNVGVSGQFLPTQLRRGSYVFLNPQTVQHGTATVFYTGNLLTYAYPVSALDGQLDIVYSTDGTRIYR